MDFGEILQAGEVGFALSSISGSWLRLVFALDETSQSANSPQNGNLPVTEIPGFGPAERLPFNPDAPTCVGAINL